MEGEVELSALIKNVNSEFSSIEDELNGQTEKLMNVKQKLDIQKTALESNWIVLKKLKESTRMDRIIKTLAGIFIVFCILFSITRYAEFTVALKRNFPENWNQAKKIFLSFKSQD